MGGLASRAESLASNLPQPRATAGLRPRALALGSLALARAAHCLREQEAH